MGGGGKILFGRGLTPRLMWRFNFFANNNKAADHWGSAGGVPIIYKVEKIKVVITRTDITVPPKSVKIFKA
jgi:hypothetical protein